MSDDYAIEKPGDNIEFTAVNIDDYEIFFSHNDNTSADDTTTEKYPDNSLTARKFAIRTDKNATLIEVNGVPLTNGCTVVQQKTHSETRNIASIFKIKIRTSTANTKIKVRWF